MKENKYDDDTFFAQYKKMPRSVDGLNAAGEWHELKKMLPDLRGKRVLDLGCGFGWHCRYAADQGAFSVVGVDISEKMLAEAREKTTSPKVTYINKAIEDAYFDSNSFDVVLSSLAFHYLESFEEIAGRVSSWLDEGGSFIFSAEHPVFTAQGKQAWYYDDAGNILHWPVDRYFSEGSRKAVFLGEEITKYHKTLTTYITTLLDQGFTITGFAEPKPEPAMLKQIPEMKNELRRPMMFLVSAKI
ncbi:class I SAM-dependent methyltransferase [Breznakiella homolactica]|uniref:Class I SAM-dependent methyltransferase n=1 Tax=Breznakiella homolactica TaxID=2798577 RepID=A0A7T8BCC7_9SPIR|nr:class I SAM-dependent methyltransferase [Breznakiella homolactica]QQO10113.1 class I SAM-dependent methyltransferase [Breznakiella homolactica]